MRGFQCSVKPVSGAPLPGTAWQVMHARSYCAASAALVGRSDSARCTAAASGTAGASLPHADRHNAAANPVREKKNALHQNVCRMPIIVPICELESDGPCAFSPTSCAPTSPPL
jgi:hypothetical protein